MSPFKFVTITPVQTLPRTLQHIPCDVSRANVFLLHSWEFEAGVWVTDPYDFLTIEDAVRKAVKVEKEKEAEYEALLISEEAD